mmetsp:Transcript_21693/g.64609  ORF Transcript_21693/g.64609 Transcript_21693/m.64609 type:complete len:460 (+) Transcript_21693:11-1390(+)
MTNRLRRGVSVGVCAHGFVGVCRQDHPLVISQRSLFAARRVDRVRLVLFPLDQRRVVQVVLLALRDGCVHQPARLRGLSAGLVFVLHEDQLRFVQVLLEVLVLISRSALGGAVAIRVLVQDNPFLGDRVAGFGGLHLRDLLSELLLVATALFLPELELLDLSLHGRHETPLLLLFKQHRPQLALAKLELLLRRRAPAVPRRGLFERLEIVFGHELHGLEALARDVALVVLLGVDGGGHHLGDDLCLDGERLDQVQDGRSQLLRRGRPHPLAQREVPKLLQAQRDDALQDVLDPPRRVPDLPADLRRELRHVCVEFLRARRAVTSDVAVDLEGHVLEEYGQRLRRPVPLRPRRSAAGGAVGILVRQAAARPAHRVPARRAPACAAAVPTLLDHEQMAHWEAGPQVMVRLQPARLRRKRRRLMKLPWSRRLAAAEGIRTCRQGARRALRLAVPGAGGRLRR